MFIRICLCSVGNDAFKAGAGPSVALELYSDPDKQLVVLQQRSPVIAGCQREFAAELTAWIKEQHFAQVHHMH